MIVRTILAVRALGMVAKKAEAVLSRSTTSENLTIEIENSARYLCEKRETVLGERDVQVLFAKGVPHVKGFEEKLMESKNIHDEERIYS